MEKFKGLMCISVFVISILILSISPSQGGITTTQLNPPLPDVLTADDLANFLVGAGITVSNVSYTGDERAAGIFSGGTGIIGFEEGVILSTGQINDVMGPNSDDGTSTDLGLLGDPDLQTLADESCPFPGTCTTFDAAVLEFDFVPDGNAVAFQYVLTSEEYNEFTNTQFNNIFAFFVNGENVALLPDGETEVAINNVNGGNPFTCSDGLDNDEDGYLDSDDTDCTALGDNIVGEDHQNSGFYINNDCSDPDGAMPCPINIEADGLTVVLSFTAEVNVGVVNHMKLAAADAGDSVLDSWIFIKAESFVIAEICDDDVDNDKDDLIDCADPDCFGASDCDPCAELGGDTDEDGVCDDEDNCPQTPNGPAHADIPGVGNQLNSDTDSIGDACDNCINDYNPDQLNSDPDSVGDTCDNCINDYNPDQLNEDMDGFGDECDNCPEEPNADTDGNGRADNCPNITPVSAEMLNETKPEMCFTATGSPLVLFYPNCFDMSFTCEDELGNLVLPSRDVHKFGKGVQAPDQVPNYPQKPTRGDVVRITAGTTVCIPCELTQFFTAAELDAIKKCGVLLPGDDKDPDLADPADPGSCTAPEGCIEFSNVTIDYGDFEKDRISVGIDIKPGSFPNSINLSSKGVTTAAVLGTEFFQVSIIDPMTITLAGAIPVKSKGKHQKPKVHYEDVTGDGIEDLVFQVETQELNLSPDDTEAHLTGFTYSLVFIEGTDSVRIVPPK